MSTRTTLTDEWSDPVNLGPEINAAAWDMDTALSADNRFLFFTSERSGGLEKDDIWLTTRATTDDAWSTPINLGPKVNTSYYDSRPGISYDGSTLYFDSNRSNGSGSFDLWQISIEPVVDLNADGIVDAADMCIIVDNWGTGNPLCDIGPMPLGDGIVDVQDLIVLAEHLFEVTGLVAHWKLDETEGIIASDNAGGNDAYLIGEPLWQPSGGQVDGMIQLDGIDDYISTPFILEPTKGSLSAFTWIKGGAPGQVIISQVGDTGETWLGINTSEGKLITGFCDVFFDPLESVAVITDGQWHHVGLVYDLDVFHRRLYVDGILVAEDSTIVYGAPSDGGLYIGASKDLEVGAFFSGMIDDVRIYRRVISPQEIAALAQ